MDTLITIQKFTVEELSCYEKWMKGVETLCELDLQKLNSIRRSDFVRSRLIFPWELKDFYMASDCAKTLN